MRNMYPLNVQLFITLFPTPILGSSLKQLTLEKKRTNRFFLNDLLQPLYHLTYEKYIYPMTCLGVI